MDGGRAGGSPDVNEIAQLIAADPEWVGVIREAVAQQSMAGSSAAPAPQFDPQWIRAVEAALRRSRPRAQFYPNAFTMQAEEFNPSDFEVAEELFLKAAKNFKADLSEAEIALVLESKTPESMVGSLRGHVDQLKTPHRSRLHDAISTVDEFGRSLSPFFDVVGLMISSNPEWAAIVWGGVRLVFQLSSNYIEYFEKLAQMIGKISDKLPQYSRQYNLIRDRAARRRALRLDQVSSKAEAKEWKDENEKWGPYYVSLAKSLSFVYSDIMWFCSTACRILPQAGLGKRERAKRFMRRLWTPMDEYFAKVIGRLDLHQKLFEEGLQEIYSTETIIHYNLVDKEMMSQHMHRQYTESLYHNIEIRLSGVQQSIDRSGRSQEARAELFEKEKRERKNQNLRHWIGAPDWTTLFDAAQKHRVANTCNWFLKHETYQGWVAEDIPSGGYDMFSEQLLFISGKPGYGKTILSTSVIEDLRKRVSKCSSADDGALAFFHFNMQHGHFTSSASALRSVLTQILHEHKEDPTFLDLASIIMDDIGSGQTVASEKEVRSILRVFLGRLDYSYLVFDALDECSNWEEFLESLEEITLGISCKIIIFCRPHLRLAQVTGGNPRQIVLEAEGNLADMKRYLEPNIQRLWDRGKISRSLSVAEVSTKIADRANSMFLWVVLMAGYLASPLLTPNDRLEAIDNMKMLEGLDAMFKKVLEDLELRIPRKEWYKILKMFQWLIVAQGPWTVEMLRTALAVQTHRKITEDDYIADFEESLLQTCGSFVEIRQGGTIGFIHLSVQEFLTISGPEHPNYQVERSFHVQREVADCSMATLCLSYITHNTPHGPMSGSESKPASWKTLEAEYPLLQYATKWWPVHVGQGLPSPKSDLSVYSEGCLEKMCQAINPIISNKKILTSWIEASWVFQCQPSLRSLAVRMSAFLRRCPEGYKREISATVDELNSLSSELDRLNNEWGHILKTEPNEIWLPSISSVGKFDHWVGTDAAHFKSLISEGDEGSILIASQVSSDGINVGMLKLWPPNEGADDTVTMEVDDMPPEPSPTWKVEYQIWSLETAAQTLQIQFEIPDHELLEGSQGVRPGQFRFPVAFSSNLSLIIVQGILLKVFSATEASLGRDAHFQVLPAPACEHMLDYNALAMNVSMSFYTRKYAFQRAPKPVKKDHKCYTWSQYMLSPNERYLIHIIGDGPPRETHARRWVLNVYENASVGEEVPSFTLRSCVGAQFRLSSPGSNKVERFMCFHPNQPILAICTLTTVSLWHFLERDSELVSVHMALLDDMNWSECGKYLHGTSPITKQPVFLNLSSYTSPAVPLLTDGIETSTKSPAAVTVTDVLATSNDLQLGGLTQSHCEVSKSNILTHGTPVFTGNTETAQLSTVVQGQENSAVVLQSMDSKGSMTEHQLVRLPKSRTVDQSSSTLVNAGDAENLRLVLNMAAQESYSVAEKADFSLPAIFDRKRDSIPVFESKKRLEWTEVLKDAEMLQGPDRKKLRIEDSKDP